jgi:hypothetical protein
VRARNYRRQILEVSDMTSFTLGSRRRMHAVYFLLSAVALNACGGDKTTGPSDGGGPKEQWVTASSRSWSIPSQSEAYKCHTELATSDEYFTGFRLASPAAVQTEVFLTMRPSVNETGDFDCDFSTVLGGEAIYAAGPGTSPLTFSGGKGVRIAAGQYVMLVVHVSNSSASPVSASTLIEGRVAAAKDVTTPIDMFFAGRTAFMIPTGEDSIDVNGGCGTGAELHLVAELSLMRTLGIRERVTVTNDALNQIIFNASFDPLHVVYSSLSSDFDLPANSHINAACTFENNTGAVVNLGESAHNELCLSGIYRYPPKPPTTTAPFECALGQVI